MKNTLIKLFKISFYEPFVFRVPAKETFHSPYSKMKSFSLNTCTRIINQTFINIFSNHPHNRMMQYTLREIFLFDNISDFSSITSYLHHAIIRCRKIQCQNHQLQSSEVFFWVKIMPPDKTIFLNLPILCLSVRFTQIVYFCNAFKNISDSFRFLSTACFYPSIVSLYPFRYNSINFIMRQISPINIISSNIHCCFVLKFTPYFQFCLVQTILIIPITASCFYLLE